MYFQFFKWLLVLGFKEGWGKGEGEGEKLRVVITSQDFVSQIFLFQPGSLIIIVLGMTFYQYQTTFSYLTLLALDSSVSEVHTASPGYNSICLTNFLLILVFLTLHFSFIWGACPQAAHSRIFLNPMQTLGTM